MNQIYVIHHYKFIDNLARKKRLDMAKIINRYLMNFEIHDALDIGTTNDMKYESSNLIIKKLKNIDKFKSLSDQKIVSNFFDKNFTKSITTNFSSAEINNMCADLVISSATIEHVGSKNHQIKMIANMINLSKKIFIIITPNRCHPIEFHTKIPFLHWLPKKIHRLILKIFKLDYFSKEENLNLLSKYDLVKMLSIFKKKISYTIYPIKLFGINSNYIVIGKKND